MKKTLLFCCLTLTGFTFSQSNFTINAGSMTWSPSNLTIDEGDSVTWVSVGSHNVNGTTASFPLNPESFGNSVGTNWTYGHRFNIPGTYQFRCNNHPSTMTGTLTVNSVGGINEQNKSAFKLYPNPVSNTLNILVENSAEKVKVIDLTGKIILEQEFDSSVDVSMLPNGMFFIELQSEGQTSTRLFVKE